MRLSGGGGRRTNVALAGLLGAAGLSGVVAYTVGTPRWTGAVAVTHALAGLALVALAPWKALVVRGAWLHGRVTAPGTWLLLLVVVIVGSGVAASASGWSATHGFLLQLHVGAALVAALVVVAHVRAHPQRPRGADLSRRTALRSLGVLGGAAAAYAVTRGVTGALALPGAHARATGSTEVGSGDPRAMPVTQWLLDVVPAVDAPAWRLAVRWPGGGRLWTYDEVLPLATDEVEAVLDCTGGWYAAQRWRGVRLDRLLPPGVDGHSVLVTSATGYARRLPLGGAAPVLLATHAGGAVLSRGHGAPLRLVAPGRRGFWWVKWVQRVEVGSEPWWLQPPLPLR